MIDFADIKNKSIKELHELIANSREDLRNLRFKAHSRQLKQVKQLGEMKNIIAQAKMILAQKLKQ